MSNTTETRWFKIFVSVITAFVVGISIANVVYYNRIRTGTCNAITRGEADAMFWINIIVSISSGLLFVWSLWRLVFSKDLRSQITHGISGHAKSERSGLERKHFKGLTNFSSDEL
ncbi:MAG: hypothetical protein COA94_02825 [Rickettsiales bacterium]|nr:MAG: hypothetical protein COA94_02825 [Rickettsiales bacterium]